MLDLSSAVLTAAESLAQNSFIPGVREAATVVSGLVGLAADHKSNAGDMERRVRWCRSIVMTLERAGKVLGKVRMCEVGSGCQKYKEISMKYCRQIALTVKKKMEACILSKF